MAETDCQFLEERLAVDWSTNLLELDVQEMTTFPPTFLIANSGEVTGVDGVPNPFRFRMRVRTELASLDPLLCEVTATPT